MLTTSWEEEDGEGGFKWSVAAGAAISSRGGSGVAGVCRSLSPRASVDSGAAATCHLLPPTTPPTASLSLSLSSVATSLMSVQELCIYSVWPRGATPGGPLIPGSPGSTIWWE